MINLNITINKNLSFKINYNLLKVILNLYKFFFLIMKIKS